MWGLHDMHVRFMYFDIVGILQLFCKNRYSRAGEGKGLWRPHFLFLS